MKRMVDDFREYARLPMPELKPLNINELITEMLGLYESSNAKIILNLQHNLPLVIGDATQLRQVIHNLLRNAEDALESKINDEKIITISTEISDEVISKNSKYIKLKIVDNGDGFPPVVSIATLTWHNTSGQTQSNKSESHKFFEFHNFYPFLYFLYFLYFLHFFHEIFQKFFEKFL